MNSGHLAGAAVDVFEEEPPAKDHPFLHAKNIILSPHIGGWTHQSYARINEVLVRKIAAFRALASGGAVGS